MNHSYVLVNVFELFLAENLTFFCLLSIMSFAWDHRRMNPLSSQHSLKHAMLLELFLWSLYTLYRSNLLCYLISLGQMCHMHYLIWLSPIPIKKEEGVWAPIFGKNNLRCQILGLLPPWLKYMPGDVTPWCDLAWNTSYTMLIWLNQSKSIKCFERDSIRSFISY